MVVVRGHVVSLRITILIYWWRFLEEVRPTTVEKDLAVGEAKRAVAGKNFLLGKK